MISILLPEPGEVGRDLDGPEVGVEEVHRHRHGGFEAFGKIQKIDL
jgi:hypothetical protein